jgi:hypothetical protein
MVGEGFAGQFEVNHPNRELVGHNHNVTAINRIGRSAHRSQHSIGDIGVGLAPRRTKRIDEELPEAGAREQGCPAPKIESAKLVPRFDDSFVLTSSDSGRRLPRLHRLFCPL